MSNAFITAAAVVVLAGFFAGAARADIYKYTDKKGVVHFTNVPTSPRYHLYQKNNHDDDTYDIVRTPVYRLGTHSDERRYDTVIQTLCRKYSVDSALVKAVIKTESDFDPFAVSPKGARGLMQLMPGTARDLRVSNPFDPMQNLDGGISYLRQMLDIFNGDTKLALAAYNAGFNTVINCGWRIPNIPETREYVEKVLYHISRYR